MLVKKYCTAAVHFLLVLLLGSAIAWGQQSKTLTESSFNRARQVLERGAEAMGGLNNFQAIENISFKSTGKFQEIGQSANPNSPYYVRTLERNGMIDLRGNRTYQFNKTDFLGMRPFSFSIVTTEKAGFVGDLIANAVFPLTAQANAANGRRAQRIFPHAVLQAALGRLGTVRWLGEGGFEGKKQQIITFADADGSQNTLYFDAKTGLLTKIETLSDTVLKGVAANEIVFSDYRSVSNVKLPFRNVNRWGGELTAELAYSEIKINEAVDASLFEMPKNAEKGLEIGAGPRTAAVTKLAKDVYYINAVETGGIFFYSSMFVAFKDYVLVVEAPLSDALSQAIIAKIKETVPDKPIKYLVPTHYHLDHISGVRSYVAEGSTIITTPLNQNLFEKLISMPHPLNPDRLSLKPRPISIETFKEKRVFSDGERSVELYNIGPTPHVDEMVIVYLPQEKIVFASDLFMNNVKGEVNLADPSTVFFYQKIQQLGLQIETIASGHGGLGTLEDLKKAAGQN